MRDARDCSNVIPEIKISMNMPVIKQKITIANVSAAALRILNGPFLDILFLSPKNKVNNTTQSVSYSHTDQ